VSGTGLGELPEIWSSPFNISATAEDSDFKFGTQLPKLVGVPFDICATAEASNFKFGMQLGFAKARHKATPRGKSGCGLGLGKLPNICVPL